MTLRLVDGSRAVTNTRDSTDQPSAAWIMTLKRCGGTRMKQWKVVTKSYKISLFYSTEIQFHKDPKIRRSHQSISPERLSFTC